MSEAKYTKGAKFNPDDLLPMGTYGWAADLTHEEHPGYFAQVFGLTVEQTIANAKLIAAAPQLLEALQGMVNKASKQNWNDNYPDQMEDAFAAIKKATGE